MIEQTSDNWNEAQCSRYRRELELMADLLIDIYLYERRTGKSLTRFEDSCKIRRKGPHDNIETI
jgi:hypothetical protein